MQKFYTKTLVSDYIKYLLSVTKLSKYPVIFDEQYMIKNCIYSYKGMLLKCLNSGVFLGDHLASDSPHNSIVYGSKQVSRMPKYLTIFGATYVFDQVSTTYKAADHSTINDTNLVSVPIASYRVIRNKSDNYYVNYISNSSVYDANTHKYLYKYLQNMRSVYNVNLLSLYNCYCQEMTTQLTLRDNVYKTDTESHKYTYLVPVHFNTKYSLYLTSNHTITVKPLLYKEELIDKYQTELSVIAASRTVSKYSPIVFEVNTVDSQLFSYQDYLYIGIHTSDPNLTLAVIEGEYNSTYRVISSAYCDDCNTNKLMVPQPSIIDNYAPFADCLVEYLVGNTIDTRELNDNNIMYIQKLLKDNVLPDTWTRKLQYKIYTRYNSLNNVNKKDNLGYITKNTEDALLKGVLTLNE